MVQKNNSKRNNKPGKSDSKPKDDKQSSKETSMPSLFKELNDPLYRKGYLKCDTVYEFYIVSRSWLRRFRRSAKGEDMEDLDVINSDLLAANIYGFDSEKIKNPCDLILKNNLIMDDDYEVVTDEAWNLLTTIAQYITIRKSFYVNADFDFADLDDSLVINAMFIDKNTRLVKQSLNMSKPRKSEAFYDSLLNHYQVESENVSFLLFDSRKSMKEFENALSSSVLLAKLIDTSAYFPFTKLKDHDALVICVDAENFSLNNSLDDNEGAYCYNCRDCTNLYFHCSCRIVSYCSIECKYSDFLFHKAFCEKISNYERDVVADIDNFDVSKMNRGMIGLSNIGNSCYLNCLLQGLKYNELIRTQLSTRDSKFVNEQAALTTAIYHFFYLIWHSSRQAIRPWFLKIAMGLKHRDYLYFEQNDAHECLMNIIDDVNDVNDPLYKAIAQSYRGHLVSKISCTSCGKEISKGENFYSLSLPLIEEKLKTKIPLYTIGLEDCLTMNTTEVIISNHTKLGDIAEGESSVILYLADQERVVYMIDNREEELTKILTEAREAKNHESILILQNLKSANDYYLGLSYTETRPTTNKFFDMKAKLCRMRLVPLELSSQSESSVICGQEIKLNILKHLISMLGPESNFSKALKLLNSDNVLVRSKVTGKLLNFEAYFSPVEKPVYPKKHNFKTETQKLDATSKILNEKKDEFEYDKVAYEAAIKKYEADYKSFIQFDKDLAVADESAKSIETLSQDHQFEMYYVNKSPVCSNCGKKMKHQCKFRADQKFNLGPDRVLEINIEFPKGSVIAKHIKASTSFESDIKGLNLSGKKAELSLKSCMDAFFSPEKIEHKCDACSNYYSMIKTGIDVYPDNLIIQFKRFATIFKDNKVKQVKNELFVDYDFTLELNGCTYDLCCVVNHKGEINHGHYTSYAFNPEINAWVLYDDDEVREASEAGQIKSKDNYLLFFRLRRPAEV